MFSYSYYLLNTAFGYCLFVILAETFVSKMKRKSFKLLCKRLSANSKFSSIAIVVVFSAMALVAIPVLFGVVLFDNAKSISAIQISNKFNRALRALKFDSNEKSDV